MYCVAGATPPVDAGGPAVVHFCTSAPVTDAPCVVYMLHG